MTLVFIAVRQDFQVNFVKHNFHIRLSQINSKLNVTKNSNPTRDEKISCRPIVEWYILTIVHFTDIHHKEPNMFHFSIEWSFQLSEVKTKWKIKKKKILKQKIADFQGKQVTANIESTLNSLEGSEIESLFISLFSMTCNKWHFLSKKCL